MFDFKFKNSLTTRFHQVPQQMDLVIDDVLKASAEYWLEQIKEKLPPRGDKFPNYETNGQRSTGGLAASFSVGPVVSSNGEHSIQLLFPQDDQHQMEMEVHEYGADITKEDGFMIFDIDGEVIRTHEVHIRPKYFIMGSRTATVNHFYAFIRQRLRGMPIFS